MNFVVSGSWLWGIHGRRLCCIRTTQAWDYGNYQSTCYFSYLTWKTLYSNKSIERDFEIICIRNVVLSPLFIQNLSELSLRLSWDAGKLEGDGKCDFEFSWFPCLERIGTIIWFSYSSWNLIQSDPHPSPGNLGFQEEHESFKSKKNVIGLTKL